MHGAIFFGSFAADFAQAASAFFFGADSSNTMKNTVSFNSRTSRGDRLVVPGTEGLAVLGGSCAAAFLPGSAAAGGGAAGAALAAWALVAELEAATGSG